MNRDDVPTVGMAFTLASTDQIYAKLFVPGIKEHVARQGMNANITKVSYVVYCENANWGRGKTSWNGAQYVPR